MHQPPAADFAPGALARYRTVGNALALLLLLVALVELATNALDPTDRDFISFWAAGRLALAGDAAAAYDNGALHALQVTVARFSGGEMPFPYTPAFLLLVMPVAWLPFPAAMATWVAATFALFLAAVRRMVPESGWLAAAFPPVLVNAAVGQNGFLTGALFIGGLAMLQRRPFAAGLVLGCLSIKPQLGLLLPVALLAAREWRAIGGATLSSIFVLLGGLLLFGPGATEAWLGQMPLYAEIAREGLVGWHKLASVYAAARQAGLAAGPAFALHLAVALAAAAFVWREWRSQGEPLRKAAVLAAATMLASPYLYLYDATILVITFFWIARACARPALVAALWCLPMVTIAQAHGLGAGPVNLNPLLPVALLVLAWQCSRANPSPQAAGASARSRRKRHNPSAAAAPIR